MDKINVAREIKELKNHLAYSKNIGFFFGAGTSCALGIPNVEQLTNGFDAALIDDFKTHFGLIKADLTAAVAPCTVNIEDILNHIRRIRELTGEAAAKSYAGVSGVAAKKLDKEICTKIYNLILEKRESCQP